MNPPASRLGLGSEFDAFLFAPIGEDGNGLTLRVVSVLGRLNLDPWQEASTLAGLPAEAAVRKLASLLAVLTIPLLEPGVVANHLVALLPHPATLTRGPIRTVRAELIARPRLALRAIVLALWILCLLALQVTAIWRDASPDSDAAQAAHAPAQPMSAEPHSRRRNGE